MMKKLLLLTASICASVLMCAAQSADVKDYGKINVVSTEDYFEMYNALHTSNAQSAYERFVGEFINLDPSQTIPTDAVADKIYADRLKMMATEVQLPYNDIVRRYISIYTRKGGVMERVLGIGRYYFPIFEQALYDNGLPLELKMLPVIESALIPVAKSSASAIGLWQMMMPTAKYYGLEINSFVDERQDPVKSTEAACRFLKDLYRTYKDWTLVIAAYNCGAGNVNKAIKRAGQVGSYWDIWEYLPRETRNYVPAFIAATYGYTFHRAHDLNPVAITHPLAVDTLMINRMLHFDQISSTIPITTEELRTLNPQYRIDVIPAIDRQYSLVLPMSLIDDFIDAQDLIYGKDSIYLKKYLEVDNLSADKAENVASKTAPAYKNSTKGKKTTYKVKNGDTLGAIASKYSVKVAQIQTWNSIKGTSIRAGQSLTIYR